MDTILARYRWVFPQNVAYKYQHNVLYQIWICYVDTDAPHETILFYKDIVY